MDIARSCDITKGTILYHFKSKDNLFYRIIYESISVEFEEVISHALSLPADFAVMYLLKILFTKRNSFDVQSIIDNPELFDKCHKAMDQVRREMFMPVFYDLIIQATKEGLFEINDLEISFIILKYGFEGFIHNNYKKFTDQKYRDRFIAVAEEICNNTLKPVRIKFKFKIEESDHL